MKSTSLVSEYRHTYSRECEKKIEKIERKYAIAQMIYTPVLIIVFGIISALLVLKLGNFSGYDDGLYTAKQFAPMADENLLEVMNDIGYRCYVNSDMSYSNLFKSTEGVNCLTSNTIVVKKWSPKVVYHEIGHYLFFVTDQAWGNGHVTGKAGAIFTEEKWNCNHKYFDKSSRRDISEYFASAYSEYVLDNEDLKERCPYTYQFIEEQLDKVTEELALGWNDVWFQGYSSVPEGILPEGEDSKIVKM